MSTKKLAKELGLLRQRSQCASGSKKSLLTNQIFAYLIVIDFESTCWREKNNYSQEIIEFPAVLLDTASGEVESEFHSYVQPQEHPTLSKFCTELTGITQMQVEAGIPLRICLSQFSRWLQNLQLEKGVIFASKQESCSAPSPSQKLCTFVTWSDWDLGVCLKYECKRKQLHKPDVLNSWIDLRSTYRLFYSRKPKGLNGALQDLGIQFSGREHSGLDDARNTAKLAARMMRDGCVMKITRRLDMPTPMVKPVSGNITSDVNKENRSLEEENTHIINELSSSKFPPKLRQIKSRSVNFDTRESLVQESVELYQSLISPKTLLNVRERSVTSEAVADLSSSVVANNSSPQINGNKSLVLCSTTLGCLSHLPQQKQPPEPGLRVELVGDEEESEDFVVETEERCGSYDDVVLESDVMNEAEGECGAECVSDFNSESYVGEEPDKSYFTGGQVKGVNAGGTSTSSVKLNGLNMAGQHPLIAGTDAHFVVPAVTWGSKKNCQTKGHITFPQIQKRPNCNQKNITTNIPSPLGCKPFVPGQTTTPNTSFAKPKAVMQNKKWKETPRSSFTIYADPSSHTSICGALDTSKNVLRSLSTNTHLSRNNSSSISVTMKKGQKITSPLCSCGRRAKRQVVSNGGPNHGRGFFCCPVRRSGGGGRIQKGCEFFKWESSVMTSNTAASVSLGQIDSTLNCRLPQRSTLRKSY